MNYSFFPYSTTTDLSSPKRIRPRQEEIKFVSTTFQQKVSLEDQRWLENFIKYLQENLSNELLSIPQVAEEFSMSQSSLFRQLKRMTGRSPKQFLIEMRMNHARYLLEQHRFTTIAKVAYTIGYSDSKAFSRAFKKQFGQIPSAYVK